MSNRQAWLAERQTCLGASDAAVVLGISPFKSRYQLWAEKTGLAPAEDLSDNEVIDWGHRLETPVAEAYADRSGRSIEMWPPYTIVRDPLRNYVACTPDAVQECPERGQGLLQVKTTSAFNGSDWADGVPLYYEVQVQQEMHCTGFNWCTVAVLIGGQKLRWFDVEKNDAFIDRLLINLAEFWQLIQDKTPPEVDGSERTAELLSRIHPDDNGATTQLPADAVALTRTIEDCKSIIKAEKATQVEAENKLKSLIGDNTFGLLPDGRLWSWQTQNRAGYTVDPGTCRVLRLGSGKATKGR